MFERAITLDPTYAEAYARLGWTYYLEWGALWSQDSQILEQAFTQAQKAIALNDSLPQAHQVLGALYLWKKQHEQAIAEIKRAIALDPNDADSYGGWAHILNFAGQPQEAIELVQKAMRLNPRYLTRYPYYLGLSYYLLKQYEEAISALKEALARNPDLQPAHLVLAATYTELGREEEAQVEVDAVLGKNPTLSLDGLRQRVPLKDPAVLGRYLAALRKAGLK
jgi:adenylate cyclase